jgi:acetyl esterase/lipase
MRTFQYGRDESQQGDLYLPAGHSRPVVCLLHGGFWRMPYGRDQMVDVAHDLVAHGFAVWNLEYRRLGAPGVAWSAILDDVAAGVDHLADLSGEAGGVDLRRVFVAGHSAGGHLALCAAARSHAPVTPSMRVRVCGVAGLAPIADLAGAYEKRSGGEVVAELLGGTPAAHPELLRAASPIEMLPLRVRQLIVHGVEDTAVPIELSRRYAQAAEHAGDDIELVELADTGHMEFLDARSDAHTTLRRWLLAAVTDSTLTPRR